MATGNYFSGATTAEASALSNVRSTLNINPESGSITFKSNLGRGSGKPVEIPEESFDEFVSLMQTVAQERQKRLDEIRTVKTSSDSAQKSDTDSESTDSTLESELYSE